MEDRVFSVEEVQAGLARGRRLLAIGAPPDGWELVSSEGDSFEYWLHPGEERQCKGIVYRGASRDRERVEFSDWPEAVRSGQAEIACRLLAAHVELERLRAEHSRTEKLDLGAVTLAQLVQIVSAAPRDRAPFRVNGKTLAAMKAAAGVDGPETLDSATCYGGIGIVVDELVPDGVVQRLRAGGVK